MLAAVKELESPLCLSCTSLVTLTGEFLAHAQRDGHARPSVTADELFLSALGMAWVLNRARACGASREGLENVPAHGYLASYPAVIQPI